MDHEPAVRKDDHKGDLPLSSNFHEVKVQHFILDMSCNVSNKKVFDCALTLFCKFSSNTDSVPAETNVTQHTESLQNQEQLNNYNPDVRTSKVFVCLDCFALDISSCILYPVLENSASLINSHTDQESSSSSEKRLQLPQAQMNYYHHIYTCLQSNAPQIVSLEYFVTEHSLLMTLPHNVDDRNPVVLKICYRTQAEGPSLLWTVDQCGRACVFTVGHLLNNRALFPCQDLPQAMSTWHCAVTLTDPHMDEVSVVMTGEAEPEICLNTNGEIVFHFQSSYPMPASTFALAVGTWSVAEISHPFSMDDLNQDRFSMPRCRLFSPECLHEQMIVQFGQYLPLCFEVLNSVLGPHPLNRLDILIVPGCFDSLGLASPHLMFLSQSLLCPNLSMFYRLSHEVCHTWFGVLTGPKDWTEEWLTEGICCYLEDIIHAAVMHWNEEETRERSTLRALLKFRILASEINNTSEDLQTLRPNMGSPINTGEINTQQLFVKNGLNQEKTVTQVHYLKGFFLLRYLENIAGREVFLQTLRRFTSIHLGKLFSSLELLDYFFENCLSLNTSGLTVAQVCQDWLDNPGMPYHLQNFPSSVIESRLVTEVRCQFIPEQLVLLLETLVEEDVAVTAEQLKTLRETHKIEEANAEVKHSWCELVIHRKAARWISDVENFLLHHQALGVYLYGELLISRNKKLQNLAYRCYSKTEADMPEGPKTVLQAMLFPP